MRARGPRSWAACWSVGAHAHAPPTIALLQAFEGVDASKLKIKEIQAILSNHVIPGVKVGASKLWKLDGKTLYTGLDL